MGYGPLRTGTPEVLFQPSYLICCLPRPLWICSLSKLSCLREKTVTERLQEVRKPDRSAGTGQNAWKHGSSVAWLASVRRRRYLSV